jgi:hypothetical protein
MQVPTPKYANSPPPIPISAGVCVLAGVYAYVLIRYRKYENSSSKQNGHFSRWVIAATSRYRYVYSENGHVGSLLTAALGSFRIKTATWP